MTDGADPAERRRRVTVMGTVALVVFVAALGLLAAASSLREAVTDLRSRRSEAAPLLVVRVVPAEGGAVVSIGDATFGRAGDRDAMEALRCRAAVELGALSRGHRRRVHAVVECAGVPEEDSLSVTAVLMLAGFTDVRMSDR